MMGAGPSRSGSSGGFWSVMLRFEAILKSKKQNGHGGPGLLFNRMHDLVLTMEPKYQEGREQVEVAADEIAKLGVTIHPTQTTGRHWGLRLKWQSSIGSPGTPSAILASTGWLSESRSSLSLGNTTNTTSYCHTRQ